MKVPPAAAVAGGQEASRPRCLLLRLSCPERRPVPSTSPRPYQKVIEALRQMLCRGGRAGELRLCAVARLRAAFPSRSRPPRLRPACRQQHAAPPPRRPVRGLLPQPSLPKWRRRARPPPKGSHTRTPTKVDPELNNGKGYWNKAATRDPTQNRARPQAALTGSCLLISLLARVRNVTVGTISPLASPT